MRVAENDQTTTHTHTHTQSEREHTKKKKREEKRREESKRRFLLEVRLLNKPNNCSEGKKKENEDRGVEENNYHSIRSVGTERGTRAPYEPDKERRRAMRYWGSRWVNK